MIGELRHSILIQQPLVTQDANGAPLTTWDTFAVVRGAIEDLSGKEFFAAQQVNAEVTTRIRIRYLTGVKRTMRATSGGRTFDILAALDPPGRQRELHLMVKEVV